MEVRFVTQPFDDGTDLRDFLHAVAQGDDLTTLRIVVAWAKRSGIHRAADDLKSVRARGGRVLAIVGVSEGGATQQGLEALIAETDEAHVFHDTGRTFHPKVYLADSGNRALLLVGSNNFTAGGLAWNYEAAIWCELDLGVPKERQVRDDVVAYFKRLRADTAVCVALGSPTLEKLLADGSLIIQNEDSIKRANKPPESDAPEDTDSDEVADAEMEPAERIFGKSATPKRKAPSAPTRAPRKAPGPNPAPVSGAVDGDPIDLDVTRRWFKKLKGSDAQQTPVGTKRTGALRLAQGDFAIDHTKYFREIFFGQLTWTPRARRAETEETWVAMQTIVDGDYLGDVNFRISHAPKRIAGQGNITTNLHWGDLSARMRENNYQNLFVSLEQGSGGRFALTIADQPTGDFIY